MLEAIKKIRRRRSTRVPKDVKFNVMHFRGEPALKQRRRLRGRKGRLSISEKVSVVHSILCQGEYQQDVAQRYQVTQSHVSKLVKMVKKDPDHYEKLINLREEKARQRALVTEKISDLNRESKVISSIPSLSRYLKQEFNIERKS